MSVKSLKEARREQILKSAEKVFSEKGFQNSTISDVAKETGVSDTTIYEYFSSKEDLLFSIPREGIELSKQLLDSHLSYINGPVNKLRGMIYHLCKFYQDNPYFANISLMTLKTNKKFMETEIYKDLIEYYTIMTNVIKEGINSGELKNDMDPYFIRSVLIGSVEFIVIRWLMYGCPDDKTQPIMNVDPLFKLVMSGAKKDKRMKNFNFKIKIEPEDEEIEE
ncbi:MAG TPA: TetR/AcrR family transcriptional regulator [Spirochaetota bacterium]|nr:TetR/AcrR family transcriptional regulator [Spirochaetota bacterium]HPJ33455.1 TetR/AcrR family transcriptional regulator [Spirochaetota bacterium]